MYIVVNEYVPIYVCMYVPAKWGVYKAVWWVEWKELSRAVY